MSDEREAGYGEGACDAIEVSRLIVEVEVGSGGDVDSIRRRVEQLWPELSYVNIEVEGRAVKIIGNGSKRPRDGNGS